MRIRGLCKLPNGRDWLWRKLGLALMGKFLIQLSANGWGCAPSLLVVWPVATQSWSLRALWWATGDLQEDLRQHTAARTAVASAPVLTAGHCWHTFHEDPQTLPGRSGSVFTEVRAFFPWVVVHTKFCVCPPRVSVSPNPGEVP